MNARPPDRDLFGEREKVPVVIGQPEPRPVPLWRRAWFRLLVVLGLGLIALAVATYSYFTGGSVGYALGHEAPTNESARRVIEGVAAKAVEGDVQPYLARIPARYQGRLGAAHEGGIEGEIREEVAVLRQPVRVSRLEWLNDRRVRVWLAGDSDGTVWAFMGGKWMVSVDDAMFARPEDDPAG